MNPPLREAADRDAMLAGLADGSVDVIATDHAPHHHDEKQVEFDRAPFGITGLETACRSASTGSCTPASISLPRLIELLSVNPARDPARAGRLADRGRARRHHASSRRTCRSRSSAATMRSKSKNTPFDGWTLRGGVAATIVGGRPVYVNDAVCAEDVASVDSRRS